MMRNGMKFGVGLLLSMALLLNACGLKEAPQVMIESSSMPQINDLRHEIVGNILRLDFKLTGDSRGVGFQVDRSQIDPYCQCPGFWRRFFEQPALAKQVNSNSYKIINLKTDAVEFTFRIRAIDTAGSFGPWSKVIRARAIDLNK